MSVPRDGLRARSIAGAIAVVIGVHLVESHLPVFHALPWMQPDSISYLEDNVARAPAYPLLLKAMQALPGGLAWLAPLQHLGILAAAAALSIRFALTFQQRWLALALGASIGLNPLLVSYAFTVLPEAAFIAVLTVHLLCVLQLAGDWKRSAAIGAGSSAAALALITPAGYAAVAGIAILAFVHRGRRRELTWLAAPPVLLLAGASVGNYLAHGVFGTQAQGGYSRAAYVGHLLDEGTPTNYGDLTAAIAARTSSIRRGLDATPGLDAYYLIAANEYHVVETIVRERILAEIGRERGAAIDDPKMFPSDPIIARRLDSIAAAIAAAAIRWRPWSYLRQVTTNVYALWWLPLVQREASAETLQRQVDEVLAQHPALDRSPIPFRILPAGAYIVVRAILGAVALCGVIGLALVFSRDLRRATVGYVACLLHGYFLLVSLAQPGLPRYAIAVWPASMLLVFAATALWTSPRAV